MVDRRTLTNSLSARKRRGFRAGPGAGGRGPGAGGRGPGARGRGPGAGGQGPGGPPLALAVPLEWNRRLTGVLALYRAQAPRFTEEDLAVLLALAPKLAACVENATVFGRAQAAGARALFERLDAEVARIRRSH